MRLSTPLLLALALALPLAAAVPAQAAQAAERATAKQQAAQAAERATAKQQAANLKLGTQLVDRFWTLIVAGDADDLRAFLSPAFQVQRANGSGQNRNQYLAAFANSTTVISDFTLSKIRVTRAGGVLVARYVSQTTQTISGTQYSAAPAPRIATFVQTPRGWRMTSNANFNAPS